MRDFISQMTSLSWWLGVVVVGLIINIAAAYAKPIFDTILGKISRNVRNKNAEKRKLWDGNVKLLSEDNIYRDDYSRKINIRYLNSIYLMLLGVIMFLFGISLGTISPELEGRILPGKYMMLIKAFLFLFGSIAALLSMRQDRFATRMNRMISEANRIIRNADANKVNTADR